jgi:hypothetical protein
VRFDVLLEVTPVEDRRWHLDVFLVLQVGSDVLLLGARAHITRPEDVWARSVGVALHRMRAATSVAWVLAGGDIPALGVRAEQAGLIGDGDRRARLDGWVGTGAVRIVRWVGGCGRLSG